MKKSCNPMMSPQTLTDVVKQVVEEKDRSRNLIVFGIKEDEEEILSEKIGDLLEQWAKDQRLKPTDYESFRRRRHLLD